MDLNKLQQQLTAQQDSLPPVEDWDPPFCGDMDMVIEHNGRWLYQGSPIGRESLVRLFASVLKLEDDDYYLVTPAEKLRIKVADRPFIVTEWQRTDDQHLVLTTNVGDSVVVDQSHPLTLLVDKTTDMTLPYVNIRRNLYARLHQNVLYQLVDEASLTDTPQGKQLMLKSGPHQFSLGLAE